MGDQFDMFGNDKKPASAWTEPDAITKGRTEAKPWSQRKDEFMEYHRDNPDVLDALKALTRKAIERGVRGDAQRLYTEFNEQYVETQHFGFAKFPREYITFYVRKIMYEDRESRGYYKLNRQNGEPDKQWNICRDWYTQWVENLSLNGDG